MKSLNHVQSVVERRNTIPILSNILLQAKGGKIRLTATDLDVEVVETLGGDIAREGATTVRRLLDLAWTRRADGVVEVGVRADAFLEKTLKKK